MTLTLTKPLAASRIVLRNRRERVRPLDRGLGLVGLDRHLDDAGPGLDRGGDLDALLRDVALERGAGRLPVRARLQFDDDRGNREVRDLHAALPATTRCRVGLHAQRRGRLVGLGGGVRDVAADEHAQEEGGRGDQPVPAQRDSQISEFHLVLASPWPVCPVRPRYSHPCEQVPCTARERPGYPRPGRTARATSGLHCISAFPNLPRRPRPARILRCNLAVQPIFILGMMRRSGTNHLSDLLLQHPDCVSAAPIHEDHLVQRAGHLRRYVDAVSGSWTASWGVPPGERARLLRALGAGIVDYLQSTPGAAGHRVVTKTPRIENLDLYPDLFAGVPLLHPRPRRPQRGRLERAQLRPERGVDPAGLGERGACHPRVRRAEPRRRAALPDRSLRRPGREARADDDGDLAHVWSRSRSLRLRRGRGVAGARLVCRSATRVPACTGCRSRRTTRSGRTNAFSTGRRISTPGSRQVAGDVQRALGYDLDGDGPVTATDRLRGRGRRRDVVAAQPPAPPSASAA